MSRSSGVTIYPGASGYNFQKRRMADRMTDRPLRVDPSPSYKDRILASFVLKERPVSCLSSSSVTKIKARHEKALRGQKDFTAFLNLWVPMVPFVVCLFREGDIINN